MEEKENIFYINIDEILPNRFQPRLHFDENELNELANSISRYGIIQPIVLRKIGDKYEIIAGERRYKAAVLAGLKKVPAIINNTDDNTSAEIALLENLQRKNLTVIEEAQSYKKLIDKGFTQEDIANKLGISQSAIANRLRLLMLPKDVKDALLYNKISERHARSLLSLNNEDLQLSLLNRIINEKLTVKQTEEEVSRLLMRNQPIVHNYIPDDIQRFLMPEVPKKEEVKPVQEEVIEYLDSELPSVINIEEPKELEISVEEKNEDNISPFQNNFSVQRKEIELPKTSKDTYNELINKINDIVKNDNKIKVSKLDLLDKYQIIIEVEKY